MRRNAFSFMQQNNAVWVNPILLLFLNCNSLVSTLRPLRLCVGTFSMVLKTNTIPLVKQSVCFQNHTLRKSTVLDLYHYLYSMKHRWVGKLLTSTILLKGSNNAATRLKTINIIQHEAILLFRMLFVLEFLLCIMIIRLNPIQ